METIFLHLCWLIYNLKSTNYVKSLHFSSKVLPVPSPLDMSLLANHCTLFLAVWMFLFQRVILSKMISPPYKGFDGLVTLEQKTHMLLL